ncbi:MAG: arginase family protein [Bacteroidetes bacterium]|nr:arginase family protein [Bacteroidota bacterium]
MDISFFFEPIDASKLDSRYKPNPHALGNVFDKFITQFPDWAAADLVILGVCEDRGHADQPGCVASAHTIRDRLYQLSAPRALKAADLGNLAPKEDLEGYYEALAFVTGTILKAGKTLLVIGGTQDLAVGLYEGHQQLERHINMVCIDNYLDIWDSEVRLTNESVNHRIISMHPSCLDNFAVVAAQSYLVSETEREAMDILQFELLRLGDIRSDMRLAEPTLRLADMVCFDMSAVRYADAPGASHPTPAGLTAEEVCQLARFVGMGYRTNAFFLTEVNAKLDIRRQTATLAALILWYFMEGWYNRLADQPKADRSNLQRYRVPMTGSVQEIVFYKHPETHRWWMEVPLESPGGGMPRPLLVPCAEADYQRAQQDEIPERWMRAQLRG